MQEMITSKAWGHGLATLASDGSVLDVWYPNPQLGDAPKSDALWVVPKELDALVGDDARRNVSVVVVRTEIDLSLPVSSTADAYLRLHLLSHLLVQPNTINLDNLLPSLPIVAFTSAGPVAADELDKLRPTLQRAGITVHAIDKFPRLLDYVTPKKVRIADASRVRLGAHLAPGTTVMHEGFVNFNAGTLGVAMVEGRISQGVVVGGGSDIGGGASIMGTLSGGGNCRVRCISAIAGQIELLPGTHRFTEFHQRFADGDEVIRAVHNKTLGNGMRLVFSDVHRIGNS